MKTNWTILLLLLIISSDIHAAFYMNSTDSLVLVKDTVSVTGMKNLKAGTSDSVGGSIVVTDMLDGSVQLLSDSLALEMLLSDTISVDSVISANDSLVNDTVRILPDSVDIGTSVMDSIVLDSIALDSFIVDSLKTDTISVDSLKSVNVNKKDSVVSKPVVIIPESVKALQKIYSNYRKTMMIDDERWDDIYLSLSDIVMNPVFFKYVVPLTYYSKPFKDASSIDSWYPKDILSEDSVAKIKRLECGVPRVDDGVRISREIDKQLLSFYVGYPQLVHANETRIDSLEVIRFDEMHYSGHNSDIISFVQNNAGIGQVEESDILVIKPNFWNYGGTGYLQFSQNYISDNWYKGGESTKSLLSGFTWQIKYDDKQKMQFEGKFEWKLGFITAPSDTVHSYKTNNDLLRLSSKLGYKAIWNWYYTLSAEFQTQLMSNYATNSDNLISAFFSPATLNVGLGMDYKLIRDGSVNLSVLLNPVNYTMYSIANDKLDPTKFNIKEGKMREHELGSRINTTLTWKMFPFLLWESKFSYTTNYEKVFSEWENTFTFVINKYLSTKLFVHARYDDGVTPKEGQGYFQLQELFSFGLNYTW